MKKGVRFLGTLLSALLLGAPQAVAAPQTTVLQRIQGPVVFSPNGRFLVSYMDREIRVWSADGKRLQRRLALASPVVDLQFTPDGRFLAAGSGDGVYTLWRTGDFRRIVEITDKPSSLAFQPFALSPDGVYLTVAKLDNLRAGYLRFSLHVWDLRSRRRVGRLFVRDLHDPLPGHFPSVSVAYHPLGRYLITAIEGDLRPAGSGPRDLLVRDLQQGSWIYGVPGSPPAEYSHNGSYFVFVAPDPARKHWQARLWHLPTNLLKRVPVPVADPPFSECTLSAQARYLACTGPIRMQHRLLSVIEVQSLKMHLQLSVAESVDTLSFSPDGRQLLVSSLANPDFHPLRLTLP
ncbi:MAG: WD40 repeat domain-containing protein [Candidatus Sericytochromatia bacterium]